MTPNFDEALTLTTEDSLDEDSVRWHGHMTTDWSIGAVPNGGYTSALQLAALRPHTRYPMASSLTTHYYRPTIGDTPCTIETQILRVGRTTTHADATLVQDGKVRARSVAILSEYPTNDLVLPTQAPAIAAPEDCEERNPLSQGLNMSIMDSLEVRLDPSALRPVENNDAAIIDAWVRFRDDRPNDALAMALFVDSFPPAAVMAVDDVGWVPTLEMTTHIRSIAESGWIQARISTSNIRGNTLIEDIRLWDRSGTNVADARQLALLLTR